MSLSEKLKAAKAGKSPAMTPAPPEPLAVIAPPPVIPESKLKIELKKMYEPDVKQNITEIVAELKHFEDLTTTGFKRLKKDVDEKIEKLEDQILQLKAEQPRFIPPAPQEDLGEIKSLVETMARKMYSAHTRWHKPGNAEPDKLACDKLLAWAQKR